MRFGTPELVREKSRELIETLAPEGGFILFSGCDIMKDSPPENIKAMVEAARIYSPSA